MAIAASLIVCGEKNRRHLYDKDAGILEGAAVPFTVFILFLLSLNCFKSPVIFQGCHNYKSLRITQDTHSQKGIEFKLSKVSEPQLFFITSLAAGSVGFT